MLKSIIQLLSNFKLPIKFIKELVKQNPGQHQFRVLSIESDEHENYIAIIQRIGRNMTFRMKPEEILADDMMTDSFSQRDIRALTYLGYLGINSPKYKILAKRLSESDNKLIFAIQEKGRKNTVIKTADEISSDEALIKGFHQIDAHMLGYTSAAEQIISEKNQKQQLLSSLDDKSKEREVAK